MQSLSTTPILLDEPDDGRFEIRPSTIPVAGMGLFALVDLPQGLRLEAIGVLVKRDSLADKCSHFADRHKFRIGDYLLIPLGLAGQVNHSSSQPNLEKLVEGNKVFLKTLREVEAGEELFFCYPDIALDLMGIERCSR